MRTLLIACDDVDGFASRGGVANAVRRSGESWTRVLDTVWYVRTTAEVEEVLERFLEVLEDGEGLVVQAVSDEPVLVNTVRRWFRGDQEAAPRSAVRVFPRLAAA